MNQQAFQRIAYAGALDFAVEGQGQGHIRVRTLIHIQMANPHVMLQHGHGCRRAHGPHQGFAPAGDHHIDIFVQSAQFGDCGAIRHVQNLHGVRRKP